MASRFAWMRQGPESPIVQALEAREPGIVRRQTAATIRSLLQQLAFGSVWTHPEWDEKAWRSQRVSVDRFAVLRLWGNALLPATIARIAAFPHAGDIPLEEACLLLSGAMQEFETLAPCPAIGRRVHHGGNSVEQWRSSPAFPRKTIIEAFLTASAAPPTLLAGLLLHGSGADGKVCPGYSDLDLHALVATPTDTNGRQLLHFLTWLLESQRTIAQFNPFSHHGILLTLDTERTCCTESALPSALLAHGVWLTSPPPPVPFTFVTDSFAAAHSIAGFEAFFEEPHTHAGNLRGPFDAIWWTSSVLLLPLLLWPLVKGQSVYKRHGIEACEQVLSPTSVTTIRRLEALRTRIGQWIERQAFEPGPPAEHPGASLHRARQTTFTADDRAHLGLNEDLLLAGRRVWEEVAQQTLTLVQQAAPNAFSTPRDRFFFSWPAALSEHPHPLQTSDYDDARQEFLDRAVSSDHVQAVYEFGSVGSPGLSDLDFLVVLHAGIEGTPEILQLAALSPPTAEVMGHDAILLDETALNDLHWVLPLFTSRQLAGPVRPLQTTFDLPAQQVAPLITRHTAVKYPADLLWLAKQPEIRWKTLLAYLNSFRHLESCLHHLSIPIPPTVVSCMSLNATLRDRFAETGTTRSADLQIALELMLNASVDVLFALEEWWRNRIPTLARTDVALEIQQYREELFTHLAGDGPLPPLPTAVGMVVQYVAQLGRCRPDCPHHDSTEELKTTCKEYLLRLSRFVAGETALQRTPNYYIHWPA